MWAKEEQNKVQNKHETIPIFSYLNRKPMNTLFTIHMLNKGNIKEASS